MKKLFLILMLALLGMTQLAAQDDYEYVPFVREGVKWVYSYTNVDEIDEVMNRPADPNLAYGTVYLTLELKGDTVINGKTYKAMHKYYGNAINTDNDTIPIYLREENKVVYGIVPDGKTYLDCPIGRPLYGNSTMQQRIISGEEFVLYDFQDPETFWKSFFFKEDEYECVFAFSDVIQVGNHLAKRYVFEGAEDYVIEGIGVDNLYYGYTLFPFKPIFLGSGDVKFKLRYVVEAGEIVYKGVNYEGPKPDQDDYEYVPFVREGVKWVYTYTNVDEMDQPADPNLAYGTVYLTLEIKGDTVINGKTYKAMHKYYGDAINAVNDTIPVYLREQDKVVYGIVPDGKTYPDCPIGQAFGNSILQNQIRNGEEFVLYDFQDPQAYWHSFFTPEELEYYEGEFDVQSITFMNIGALMTKCYNFPGFRMIEGIGMDGCTDPWFPWYGYTLFPLKPTYGPGFVTYKIRYVTEGDEIIYKSVNYEGEKPSQDDYEYVPFVREGVKWVYSYTNVDDWGGRTAKPYLAYGTVYLTLELKGDTVINGKTYKAMHKYYGDAINTDNDTIPIYLREEDKVVYGIVPDGKTYPDCPIGQAFAENYIRNQIKKGEEFVLYDFQDPQAYWHSIFSFQEDPMDGLFDVQSITYINIGARMTKCYNFPGFCMIEGIGMDAYEFSGYAGYTLFPWQPSGDGFPSFRIRYVVEDGEIIYKGLNYEGEKPDPDDYEYVPFVREGVKWVCYYDNPVEGQDDVLPGGIHFFTFEIKGDTVINGKAYKPVHYYSGNDIDPGNDTVPVFVREDQKVVYALIPDQRQYLECPIGIGTIAIFPNIYSSVIVGREFPLYRFRYPEYYDCIDDYDVYLYNVPAASSTRSVVYDGMDLTQVGDRMNRRYNYHRNDAANDCVVEGIGYAGDSAGTPFNYFYGQTTGTNQVQYYLSHVVKDGKIIFKTANYRNPHDGINEVVADGTRRPADPHYYNLMGQPVGTTEPTTPGIYIHQGRKVVVR